MKNNRTKKGFTLIELLVVILILAILMAVALPLYLSSQKNAELRTCRANLQTIANAVQAAKVINKDADYGRLITNGLGVADDQEPDLQSMPICPNGGTYSIAQGNSGDDTTYKVSCTIHGDFQPGVNSE